MDADILKALNKCETLQQMVNVISANYDTTQKLGVMQKGMILSGIDTVIQVAQLKPKKTT